VQYFFYEYLLANREAAKSYIETAATISFTTSKEEILVGNQKTMWNSGYFAAYG
jgi:hypothetical protein